MPKSNPEGNLAGAKGARERKKERNRKRRREREPRDSGMLSGE